MKILMLSDFHIGNENFDMHKSFHFIDRAYDAISGEIDYGETIIIRCFRDFVRSDLYSPMIKRMA